MYILAVVPILSPFGDKKIFRGAHIFLSPNGDKNYLSYKLSRVAFRGNWGAIGCFGGRGADDASRTLTTTVEHLSS